MGVARFTPTGQPCLLHHALHLLMIDLPALPHKRFRHATVSIASEVTTYLMPRLAQGSIVILLDRGTTMLILPLPIDREQETQCAH